MQTRLAVVFAAAVALSAQRLPPVPDSLKPPSDQKLVRKAHATGNQIYTCDGSQWVLTGPDAKLFDSAGKEVGSHFAGPTWEWSDGSRVVGHVLASATPNPDSIPWLLLNATDHQGDGVMRQVLSIQRLSTEGGKAAAGGCDAAHKGDKTRSHYTAEYDFYAGND